MNSDLMKDKLKLYIPYIQLLYSGLLINNFNFSYSKNLYRGALIKREEIENLIKHMKKAKNSNIPCGLIYSKAFMSFSLDEKVAMHFMQNKNPTEKDVRVLYILESLKYEDNILMNKNETNADLSEISFFEDEKEILLFPFSIYEISNIIKKEYYYIIYMNILGKYKKNYHLESQLDLIKSISRSKYIRNLQQNSLLPMALNFSLKVVHFTTADRKFQLSWVCKATDTISIIEENLYIKYPELKYKKCIFIYNGCILQSSETLDDYDIEDDDVILINSF
jgi:hypothetical protein